MMNVVRFERADLALFAAASHDCNPLHLSPLYARKTAFGEPVVFGILAALATVGASSFPVGHGLAKLSLTFRNPLFCGVDYNFKLQDAKASQLKLTIEDAGRVMVTGRLDYRPRVDVKRATWYSDVDPQHAAAQLSAHDLQAGFTIRGEYGPARAEFEALLDRWQLVDKGMSSAQLAVLLWCSYLIGMRVPGERAVFSQLRLEFEPDAAFDERPLSYRSQVNEFDDRFDLVHVGAVLERGDVVCARAELTSYVRQDSPAVSRQALEEQLRPSTALSGKTALVVGGSRGLGAALVAALASQGCHVLLNYRFSTDEAAALQERLRAASGQITLARGDAGDASWCRQLRHDLILREQPLDFLVCSASPAIRNLGFALESVDRIRAFVDESLALVSIPIACFQDRLEAGAGRVVVISSEVASAESPDYPADWPHYIAAKYAIEGLVRAAAAQAGRKRFLIVRPPRLLTDQTNTASGREGAIPVEGIAARIVERLCNPQGDGPLEILNLF